MKTKTYFISIIVLIISFTNSCKKEDKRPKIEDTEEAKQTDFVKLNLKRYSDNTISKFSSFVFSFAKPIDTDLISIKGESIKYVRRRSLIQYEKNGLYIDVEGNWILNSNKDTLEFIPSVAFKDSLSVNVNLEIVLYYTDDIYDNSSFTIKEKLKIKDQFVTATPNETNELSPLTNSFELSFAENMNKEIYDVNRYIRFDLDTLELYDKTNKKNINIIKEYIADNKLKITTAEPLNSNSLIQFNLKIKVSLLKNGVWEQFTSQGKPYKLIDSISYFTLIYNLDPSSIEYSYPESRQYNFLTKESFKGYVKLKAPFMLAKEPGLVYSARYNLLHGDSIDVALKFNSDSNYFSYDIPQTLQNEKIYRLRFLASNNSETYNFYDIYFRTSKYETFEDKWKNVTLETAYVQYAEERTADDYITSKCTSKENFDFFENRHIKLRALLDKTKTWTSYSCSNSFYYNLKEGYILYRKEEPYGYPPQFAVCISNNNIIYCRLSDQSINSGICTGLPVSEIYYKVFSIYNQDFECIYGQIMKKQDLSEWAEKILYSDYLSYPSGSYYCELKYILPNGETIYNTEVELKRILK